MQVFGDLDVEDLVEASLWRGEPPGALALFADWRGAGPGSLIAFAQRSASHGEVPFAVMALTPTNAAGVACAALMSRDRRRWRGPLIELARYWRRALPGYAAERGLSRIEARSWAGHPTGGRFMLALGFRFEAHLAGFAGGAVFDQYAWTAPDTPAEET